MNRRHVISAALAVAALFTAVPALAAKGGGRSKYGTLAATPYVLHAGDYFTVSGCGYDPSLGDVLVGFVASSHTAALDSNGCFTVPDIPALSGDTLPPGTYEVSAYQRVRGKLTETGETVVTVVA